MKKLHLLLLFLISAVCTLAQEKKEEPKTLEISAKAPDFSLKGIDSKMHSLSTYDDADVLAILFTCNHCPTAQAYEERVINLVNDYKDKSFQLVAISSNAPNAISLSELGYTDLSDTYEEMQIRAEEMNYNFPYLYDGDDQDAALKYGPVATPHIFVFDKARTLSYVGRLDASEKPGTANAEDVRQSIDELLAGKKVSNPETKTFGCSIKWGWKDEWVQKQLDAWAAEEVSIEPISTDGIRQLIANDSDKLRLINVWATWCGPCVMEFPEFIEIDRMYRGRDFEFISISADQPTKQDKALAFLKKKEASNKNYIFNTDDKYALIEAIDPEWQGALPYTLLVEPGGSIVYSKQGTIDPQEMKRAIVENQYIGRYY
ncbi:redoxin family protein [Catalinimonas niigatensis]|uniref:redoxin family protein n=1 Tax=Catalinimonas niigatensis TaxID=1397264 RepID=UPI0026652573|nr:redoxin family protein [Catalinimonas niigatensis]WPP53273.1 redoxin family protein [Catalinimonas niigatensis]